MRKTAPAGRLPRRASRRGARAMTLLAIERASKSYAGVPALRAATLAIAAGEIHALMGENGAGKSTLIRILAGVERADEVAIAIDGRPVSIADPGAAHRLGLRFIHQELNIVPTMSVAENIFLGRRYPRRLGALVDWRRLRRDAGAALARLGIAHVAPDRPVAKLGFGDRMLVRIAAAFLDGDAPGRVYVMDEPTAALTAAETDRLFAVLDQIRRSGRSVIYVSHRLDEIMRLCDRVTVLRDGAVVDTRRVAETSAAEIIRMMIGRSLGDAYPRLAAAPAAAEAMLQLDGLAGPGIAGVSLAVAAGEVVGLAGLAGAGPSELHRLLIGAAPASRGSIMVAGHRFAAPSPAAAWSAGLAFVPRDRRGEGILPARSVSENMTLPHLSRLSRGGIFPSRRRERRLAAARGADVRLHARGPGQRCRELSGGNQQKVVLARAIAGRPRILLLDEPTRGVDIAARFDIYALIRELKAAGTAVLLASSDAPELIGLSDRIAVMRGGRIAAMLAAAGLGEETLLAHCHGRPPAA
jgi:ribose transport system ATP-binding protein